jgi:hypothetical protein
MAFRTFVACVFASGKGAEEHDKKWCLDWKIVDKFR